MKRSYKKFLNWLSSCNIASITWPIPSLNCAKTDFSTKGNLD